MKKWLSYILSVTMACLCYSCSGEEDLFGTGHDGSGNNEGIVIRLGITSRGDGGSSISGADNKTITNLKVWMVNEEDDTFSFYKEINDTDGIDFNENDIYSFEMEISLLKPGKYGFYILANSNHISGITFDKDTKPADLQAAYFTEISGGNEAQVAIPMYGEYHSVEIVGSQHDYYVQVPIIRVLSKLELYMTKTSDDFTLKIKKATLSRMPKRGYLKNRDMEEMKKESGFIDMNRKSILFEGETIVESISFSYEYADAQPIPLSNAFIMENPYGKVGVSDNAELVVEDEEERTDDEKFSYHLTIEYTIDDKPLTQTIRLPQVKRNIIDKIYCWVNENGTALELTLAVQPWNTNEESWNYTETVTVKEEGIIKWTDGSCNIRNEAEVYMIYATTAECTFTIDTPVGGTWHASLIPVSGNYDAFAFEGEASGEVGKPATLRIKTAQDDVTENSKAELQIVVRTIDGRTIVVNNLLGESSTKTRYTLVQSK